MEVENMKLDPQGLKAARMSQGFTQDDMGELLGVSGSAYAKKEQGVTEFRMKEALVISDFLEEPLEKIFCYELENNSGSKAS